MTYAGIDVFEWDSLKRWWIQLWACLFDGLDKPEGDETITTAKADGIVGAVECEQEFVTYSCPIDLIVMNCDMM